jgi:FkbM family methyltransferase
MAKCEFDYHGLHIEAQAPTFQTLWTGLKHYITPYEKEFHTLKIAADIDKCKIIVDVGACIGAFSMLYSQANPNAKIYAYEPATINYKHLVENMKNYPNVICRKKALGHSNGSVEIALPSIDQKSHIQTIDPSDNTGIISIYGKSDTYRETVPCVRLDDEIESADFIKIDAEGHEYNILLGMERIMRESHPRIILEMFQHNMEMAGVSPEEMVRLLLERDYRFVLAWRQDWLFFHKSDKVEETKRWINEHSKKKKL